MDYLDIGRSGIWTIMLPINILIGEYTLYFKLNGRSRKNTHIIMSSICLLTVVILKYIGNHPYYLVALILSTFGGIIQQEWIWRDEKEIITFNKVDIFLKGIKICMGIIILFIIPVIRMKLSFVFLNLPLPDRYIAYFILIALGLEHIVLNGLLIKKFYYKR